MNYVRDIEKKTRVVGLTGTFIHVFHIIFAESRWEVPAEGFISMKDQSLKTAAAATTAVSKKETPKSFKRKSGKSDGHKVSGKAKFDKSKKKTKSEVAVAPAAASVSSSVGSSWAPNYGTWETVVSDDRFVITYIMVSYYDMEKKYTN